MSLDTLRNVLKNLAADEVLAPGFELVWHSGEPLVVGRAFFKEAAEAIRELLPGLLGRQTFQTNGLLIDDNWCQLFNELNAVVGVSLDGPRHFHDAHRKTKNGKGTFDAVMRGIDTLRRNKVDFYIISVLTQASLLRPESIFAFAKKNDLQRMCFNIEETEGINCSETYKDPQVFERARRFFDAAIERMLDAENRIWVREISDALFYIEASAREPIASNHLNVPFKIITVDASGNWSTFCPELMAARNPRFGKFHLGNLAENSISAGMALPKFEEILAEINRGVGRCRETCEYFSVCGGGRPTNKQAETGRFDVSETQQCRLTVKAVTDACLSALTKIQACEDGAGQGFNLTREPRGKQGAAFLSS